MNFTAQLPNGMDKASWIASLPKGSLFCTRRPMKCAICGKNSLQHNPTTETCKDFKPYGLKIEDLPRWQPLLPRLKVGKKYAICSGRGTKAICVCGRKAADHNEHGIMCMDDHSKDFKARVYRPLTCELVSVMDEEEWRKKMSDECFNFAQERGFNFEEELQEEYHKILHLALKDEAKREGFITWTQLDKWIMDYYGGRPKMWRYEFRR